MRRRLRDWRRLWRGPGAEDVLRYGGAAPASSELAQAEIDSTCLAQARQHRSRGGGRRAGLHRRHWPPCARWRAAPAAGSHSRSSSRARFATATAWNKAAAMRSHARFTSGRALSGPPSAACRCDDSRKHGATGGAAGLLKGKSSRLTQPEERLSARQRAGKTQPASPPRSPRRSVPWRKGCASVKMCREHLRRRHALGAEGERARVAQASCARLQERNPDRNAARVVSVYATWRSSCRR